MVCLIGVFDIVFKLLSLRLRVERSCEAEVCVIEDMEGVVCEEDYTSHSSVSEDGCVSACLTCVCVSCIGWSGGIKLTESDDDEASEWSLCSLLVDCVSSPVSKPGCCVHCGYEFRTDADLVGVDASERSSEINCRYSDDFNGLAAGSGLSCLSGTCRCSYDDGM